MNSRIAHASTLKRWEQGKHKRLSATVSFLHTLKSKALTCDRDDLFIPDLQTELPIATVHNTLCYLLSMACTSSTVRNACFREYAASKKIEHNKILDFDFECHGNGSN